MQTKSGAFNKQWIGWKSITKRPCDITIMQESSGDLHLSRLAKFDIYWIEEPTSADDILGHKYIAEQLKPYGKVLKKMKFD